LSTGERSRNRLDIRDVSVPIAGFWVYRPLSAITSETFGITENLVELTKQRTDFNKNVKDLAPKVQVENDPLKAKEVAQKAASVSPPIVDADLFKPDV